MESARHGPCAHTPPPARTQAEQAGVRVGRSKFLDVKKAAVSLGAGGDRMHVGVLRHAG